MPSDVRKLAFEFAEILKIKHPFDCIQEMAGEDWLGGFLKRHQELAIQKPEPISIGRVVGFNKPQANSFFSKLRLLLRRTV